MQHGRRKVAVSQEKLDARAQKALKYKALETTALELRTQHIHDAHSLEVSKKVLSVNPEFYTMWNYRREILIDLFPTWTDLERTQWGESELSFLEFAIRENPKCYWIWNHRRWTMQSNLKPNWDRELSLCAAFLRADERNFHCWNYREFCLKQMSVRPSVEDELFFTQEKIEENFSNFSAWQRRAFLINSPDLTTETMSNELEFASHAIFTSPEDQSAWLYVLWLLSKCKSVDLGEEDASTQGTLQGHCHWKGQRLQEISPHRLGTRGFLLPHTMTLSVAMCTEQMQTPPGCVCQWYPVTESAETLRTWLATPSSPLSSSLWLLTVTLLEPSITNGVIDLSPHCQVQVEGLQQPRSILPAALALRATFLELLEMEPASKWGLLALTQWEREFGLCTWYALQPRLDTLKEMDPFRQGYYHSLQAQVLEEEVAWFEQWQI